jgi:hypothetical protein
MSARVDDRWPENESSRLCTSAEQCMRRTNTVIAVKPGPAPAPRVILTQGVEKRALTIPELAQYLGMTNWAAEEALREGKIRFKWMGKRKIVDRRDADSFFDALPYAEIEIKQPKPLEPKAAESKCYMSDRELRVRGLRVYRGNGSTTQRKRVRAAKVLGFRKDSDGKICVQYI